MSAPPATAPAPAPARFREVRAWAARRRLGAAIVVLCLFGLGVLVWNFSGTARAFPGPALLSAFLLAVVLYVAFTLLRRVRPVRTPPRKWSWAGVAWGATAATGCALLANGGLSAVWSRTAGVDFASSWGAALTAPLNEEGIKTAGIVLLGVAFPARMRGPLDGWVLGALVGLGFQMAENWTYALNGIVGTGGTTPGDAALQSVVGRVLYTGLGSHWTMSAVAGTGVGLLLSRSPGPARRRRAGAAACVLTAVGMHWLFNAPFLGGGLGTGVKAAFDFLVAGSFWIVLRHAYRHRARAELRAPGVAPGADRLLTRRGRRRARAAVPQGAERERYARLMVAQLDLLEERAGTGCPRSAFEAAARARVAEARYVPSGVEGY
ncbi:PrsW family intramembrane metalloprotease [Streptomyces sp. NPDC060243]|uniref:PrsW family intramembrane metalloprotease n=1 Tax=Streptomyces sp. NPDC060243 TaxID=3347081 RepID=UPI003650E3A3